MTSYSVVRPSLFVNLAEKNDDSPNDRTAMDDSKTKKITLSRQEPTVSEFYSAGLPDYSPHR